MITKVRPPNPKIQPFDGYNHEFIILVKTFD